MLLDPRYLVFGILFVLSLFALTLAADRQSKSIQITGLEQPILSPDGRLQLLWRRNDFTEMHEIWLRSTNNPREEALIYSFGRDADVLWSPDSTMVAITDRAGSSEAYVTVFRIVAPNKFEEMKEVPQFIEKTFFKNEDGSVIFSHSYALAVTWSPDSKSLLVELSGYDALDGTKRQLQKKVKVKIPGKK